MLGLTGKPTKVSFRDHIKDLWEHGYLQGGFLVLLAVAVLGAVVFLVPGYMRSDLAGAELRTDTGTIVRRTIIPPYNGIARATVVVHMKGLDHTRDYLQDLPDLSRLQPGTPVRIDYRVGQSGRVYIDRIEPVAPRQPDKEPSFTHF